MNNIQQSLNLARKWRPQSFDQVVGQDISIRMLKNGLFLNKFFPVYLFAGQRGCGKTTTARIFAAAINCNQLPFFQQNPTNFAIPCLDCNSCRSMINGNHPDFIEIDAASHTGVDNVRQIIESSSYMPLMGRKKIYLIDEAHMLSKAAFNAFLKILEEPPLPVVFILATTEIPKVPATVLSRCFQIMFNPIDNKPLKQLLRDICTKESVVIEEEALDLILNETEGSARDAINLLERVRFSGQEVTERTVLQVLGKISVSELITLFDYLIEQAPQKVLAYLHEIDFQQRSPQFLWDMIINLCRNLTWIKYGVETLPGAIGSMHKEALTKLSGKCSFSRLNAIFNFLWSQEELFMKTNKKHIFLEMTLLGLCQQVNVTDLEDLINQCKTLPKHISSKSDDNNQTIDIQQIPHVTNGEEKNIVSDGFINQKKTDQTPDEWKKFIDAITKLNDQLLSSILMQATYIDKNSDTKYITISLSTNSSFFKKKIEETTSLWLPYLIEIFGDYKGFEFAQEITKTSLPEKQIESKPPAPTSLPITTHKINNIPKTSRNNDFLIIKNPSEWPIASLLLSHFSGKIKQLSNT